MFYIYEWFNVDTNEIFYVGKGTANRYRVRNRNKDFNAYIKENNCNVRIIEYFTDELECFKAEENRINELMAIGQCKCNRVYGGNGGVKYVWTKELRMKMSKDNPMYDTEQRKRMSVNNPMKNSEVAKRVGQKHRVQFFIGNNFFNGLSEASEVYNVTATTVSDWLRKGKTPKGEIIRRIEKQKPIVPINKEECYLIFNDKKYKSITDLCEKEGLNKWTVRYWIKKGFSPNGDYIRYSTDKKDYAFIPTNKTHNNIPILVDKKQFSSKLEAAKYLNVSVTTLNKALKNMNTDKLKNIICEYANQQPSRGNTDNSTTKGSTTNG